MSEVKNPANRSHENRGIKDLVFESDKSGSEKTEIQRQVCSIIVGR